MSNFVKKANSAFADGDFSKAVLLYEQAIFQRPELAGLYRFNLELARAKLGLPPKSAAASSAKPDGIYLEDLYREVEPFVIGQQRVELQQQAKPLVTVVMTTHNVTEYVEQAITSVLRQTYKPIEVVVVDDYSTDGTWQVLQRIAREYPLVVRRLNTNLGTYFAKNAGLKIARGEFVFFQDGDDLSHPDRIRLCMHELQQPGAMCVQGSYSRVLFPSGQVLPVNGLIKKLGLITLGLRRSVFEEIGFFNCTTKASDDEFFHRIQQFYRDKAGSVRPLDLPLYYNTFREGSLFGDMVANNPNSDGHIEQTPSPVRKAYVDDFKAFHRSVTVEKFKETFKFPVVRDLIGVAPEMTKLANPSIPVVVSLCSIPERMSLLKRSLASLSPQVDEIHLYLDRYESVPEFISNYEPKIIVRRSQDFPSLRDNAKFIPMLDRSEACYFFTADDDIIYPPDYVNAFIKKIEAYERTVVIGLHGVLINERPNGYFSCFRRVLSFKRELESDQLVNNLGTGTVAFYSGLLKGLDYRHFQHPGMVDLYFAVFCKNRGVPLVSVSRPDGWLVEMDMPDNDAKPLSLFEEGSMDDTKQSELVRQHAPWGYRSIINAVEQTASVCSQSVAEKINKLVPSLTQCLW